MTELPRHWKPLIKLRPDEMYLRPEIVREAMNHYGIGEVEARRMLDEEHRKFATRSSLGCVHRETPPRPGLSCAVTRICIVLEPKSERSTSLCTRPYVDDKCAVLSPTTRRSILLIRSERSTSAALIAAIVSRNVLTFDPSDTIPPITTAIDPMAVT
jgi:hypothetical protein